MSRPPSGVRPPPREVVELRALANRQPNLAQAAELHGDLVALVRRVESRLTTPVTDLSTDLLMTRLARGVPLAAFGEFPLDWAEIRLLIRQVTDVLRRVDVVDAAAAQRLHGLERDPDLADKVREWYEGRAPSRSGGPADTDAMSSEVLLWALRPFLIRAASVLTRRISLDGWRKGTCPVCGAEPDFAILGGGAEQTLLCGRCHARWPVDRGCPFCGNRDKDRLRTLATPDRVYRVIECLECGRYLKAMDPEAAGRPLMPFYDPVATLPLDAAMMQK